MSEVGMMAAAGLRWTGEQICPVSLFHGVSHRHFSVALFLSSGSDADSIFHLVGLGCLNPTSHPDQGGWCVSPLHDSAMESLKLKL